MVGNLRINKIHQSLYALRKLWILKILLALPPLWVLSTISFMLVILTQLYPKMRGKEIHKSMIQEGNSWRI